MDDIAAKRVYDDAAGATEVVVAADPGVAVVRVSGDRVGEFGMAHRCSPRDVAAADGRVAVATDEDVLLAGGDDVAATDFGPATAVGFHDGVLAADEGGRIARRDGDWREIGAVDGRVNAIDGALIAAEGGVYRVADGLAPAGLADVRDVAAADPLAATGDGLYRLGNGWLDVLEGDFHAVASDGTAAHAATPDACYERVDGEWRPADLPVDERVVDVAYGECPYAVTAAGTLLADGGGGWRSHALGLRGAVGLAVVDRKDV